VLWPFAVLLTLGTLIPFIGWVAVLTVIVCVVLFFCSVLIGPFIVRVRL
jgi:hypothetical protein